ncbi:TetR/AcrR family transcriptional regulator [Nonomuraea sp. NPDC050783]|uniref:TetR/AcrR family transcriptional regulator n=1 Tax=Nonomuraea sp. NPDC050783 TaxID=3154634 RepID=UPI0034666FAA
MPGGRPRAFDPDAALDRALEVFWRQGYEGTSLSDLTTAMGINRPSLYGTFGNKEELFAKVLERYVGGPGAFAAEALEAPTVREVAERLVRGAVELTSGPGTPGGCLNVKSVHACGPDSAPARQAAIDCRKAGETALRRRLEQAPDLPPGQDPATLARLLHTITDGIAVQAAGGRPHDELSEIAELALRALLPPDGSAS